MDRDYILVTGATSGIGAALAQALVHDGVPVVACGRNPKRLDAFMKLGGGITLTYLYDLTETEALEESLTAFLRAHACNIRPLRGRVSDRAVAHDVGRGRA